MRSHLRTLDFATGFAQQVLHLETHVAPERWGWVVGRNQFDRSILVAHSPASERADGARGVGDPPADYLHKFTLDEAPVILVAALLAAEGGGGMYSD